MCVEHQVASLFLHIALLASRKQTLLQTLDQCQQSLAAEIPVSDKKSNPVIAYIDSNFFTQTQIASRR